MHFFSSSLVLIPASDFLCAVIYHSPLFLVCAGILPRFGRRSFLFHSAPLFSSLSWRSTPEPPVSERNTLRRSLASAEGAAASSRRSEGTAAVHREVRQSPPSPVTRKAVRKSPPPLRPTTRGPDISAPSRFLPAKQSHFRCDQTKARALGQQNENAAGKSSRLRCSRS